MTTATEEYFLDRDSNVWIRRGFPGLNYSDGQDVENNIFDILKETTDLSILSDELQGQIHDWPTMYHLSAARHCLLRPLDIDVGAILEIGSGCGAITRYLAESASRVIALEGSKKRAAITAERCRDLDNVEVYCDALKTFRTDTSFDIVTLIGVLEYSRLFFGPVNDPIQKCLQIAFSLVKDGGILILAIENQLGLKYFNGSEEDHTGTRFYGINDLYGKDTPVTFGKHELIGQLKRSGFQHNEVFFPFPDYKLPSLIITERALNRQDFDVSALLLSMKAESYIKNSSTCFDERLAWKVIGRNRLISDFSNSFLIVSSKNTRQPISPLLACAYATSRQAKFATQTKFLDGIDIIVRKDYLSRQKAAEGRRSLLSHKLSQSKYCNGTLLIEDLLYIAGRNADIEEFVDWVMPWVSFLRRNSFPTDSTDDRWDGLYLPNDYIDCIPQNLIRDQAGCLRYIDREWEINQRVPLYWVLVRGILYSLPYCSNWMAIKRLTCVEFIDIVCEMLGIVVERETYYAIGLLEDTFQKIVTCGRGKPFQERLNERVYTDRNVFLNLLQYRASNNRSQAELLRLNRHFILGFLIRLRRWLKNDPSFGAIERPEF